MLWLLLLPMDTHLENFLQLAQKACLPGIWSKGVALAREKCVIEDRKNPEEIVLRVRITGRPVSAKVSLWPADEDWFCDCGDKADPCMHIAAGVAALRNGWVQGGSSAAPDAASDPAPGSPSLGCRIVYRFARVDGGLALERWIERGQRKDLLIETLVSYAGGISSGRIAAPPLAATQEDFAIDQLVGRPSRAALHRAALERVLKILAASPHVELDSQPIEVASQPVTILARIKDEGNAFRIQGEREDSVTEVFQNGAALCGAVLRPFPDPGLSAQERECVSRSGKLVSAADAPLLVTELLPGLQKKIRVEIETRRLPELRQERPRVELRLDPQGKETLSVFPVLVYGDPPIAEIHQDKVHPLRSNLIPWRDPAAERELVRRLQAELQLQPSHRVSFSGEAAVRFVSELRDWDLTGPGVRAFSATETLVPQIQVHEGRNFGVAFSASGQMAESARVFQAWEAGESFVPLLGGGWAPLPKDWLMRYGARVRALLESARSGSKAIPPELGPELASLCEELGAPCPESLKRLKALLTDFQGIPEAPLPPDLNATLRSYQKKGVDWLRFLSQAGMGALLADDMGLGKTLQALSAIQGRTLVICPTSVLQAWSEQIEQFRPGLKYLIYHGSEREALMRADQSSLVLTTYGVLRLDQERLSRESWDTVILDEAQTIKNPESQVARAAHRLQASFRIALSGTPVENRLEDLWSQFRFLSPGLLGTRESFQERYAAPIARGDAQVAAELRQRIRPFILRRLKREVAPELPPRTETVLHCELSPPERELYDSILAATRKEVLTELEQGSSVLAVLEALLRLRQACCHPALVPGGTGSGSAKLELLLQSLESSLALGHRALIFSQWTSYLDLIGQGLEGAGIAYSRLDGSTRDREGVVRAFQAPDGPPIMLLSLKAGGVGITLTAADHVYIMDPWWNPAAEDQAADRAHRIGQENPVLIHRLVAEGTVEDRILALQKRKLQLAGSVLGAGEAGGAAALTLTREDLLALISD